jgi:hypothetical protein
LSRVILGKTAGTWPVFAAFGVIKPGSEQNEVQLELRAVRVEIRTRLATDPSRLTRKWVVTPPAPVGAVITPTIRSSAQESRKPKIKARKIAIRAPKPRKATVATTVNSLTGIATTGSCGQDHPGDDRREVEPDQHDHRPADHRGQDLAQSAATDKVDQPADGGRRELRHSMTR